MTTPNQVLLVPVDFGPASDAALEAARDLSGPLGASVLVLHVYTVPRYGYPGLSPTLLPDLAKELETAAKRAVDDLVATRPDVRGVVREGDPAAEILATIDDLRPRLVVIGTHGRRGLTRLLLGSVAERVLRSSPVPVMTIRAGAVEEAHEASEARPRGQG